MRHLRYALPALTSLLPALACAAGAAAAAADDASMQSARTLFRSNETFWTQQIGTFGGHYRPGMLTFFNPPLHQVCGVAAPLTGPFYCPMTETVYLDQGFVQHLHGSALGVGEPALAYLVAHELAHHVQSMLGTTDLVDQARARSTPQMAARTLATFELQADCYAGLWLRWAVQHGSNPKPADLAAVLDAVAASAQWQQSRAHPGEQMLDPLTQGTAAQRLKWLQLGFNGGDFNACDTFSAEAAGKL
jgi:predicted metalloprotease